MAERDATSPRNSSRRSFLRKAAGGLVGAALLDPRRLLADPDQTGSEQPKPGSVSELSPHLLVYHGPINVGIVRDGARALLIDCGDGSVRNVLASLGIRSVEQLVFTHHHRDQACGAGRFTGDGTKVGVPGEEQAWFDQPMEYWNNDDKYLWKVYASFRPHSLMLADPLEVDEAYSDGHSFDFGPAKVGVLATPGHTEGSVSYVVEVDGRRVVFSGDAIYGEGQAWDVYSLQKGFEKGGRRIGGYHGFMGDRWRLVESLERIVQQQPDLIVPAHGTVMTQPARAVETLTARFEDCYENYVAISALRHYFPELFTDYEGRPGQMPIRPGIEPPDCLRHFGTTWMLVSESGDAFVMDIGSTGIFQQLKKRLDDGEIKSVEGLWVTHYHFDHTAGIPDFQQEFDVPCIADRRLADVLTNPTAWRLPCVDPRPITVHRPTRDGESWQWREFKLTAYFLPGQTLYHGGLLAEAGDLRMFFVGDSHTMAGIDDYCAQNRNWLGRGVGFQYCLDLIERLRPTHIFNCHVNDAFTFTPDEIAFMRKNLDRREQLFGQLVPWEHANFGLDPSWVRAFPYTQQAKAGGDVSVKVVVTNHAAETRPVRCRAAMPKALGGTSGEWQEAEVAAKAEGELPLRWALPADLKPGRCVVPIDVVFAGRSLPQFTEAIVDVG
ncbi:MAG: MBL fold metallo-hydrolase [Thermoguttaceae bacterium]|jgi:glyoxylase-like metal-dependent hydrolase (beta-lactamase superfamily II)|nr:MBL fold metallo-hydrolase [Thermoguttaceae bacterium]